MSDDEILRELAEHLRHHRGPAETADELAAVMEPFVRKARAEATAKELRALAEALRRSVRPEQWPTTLDARADALEAGS